MSASWYDVLGVDSDATADEVRDAWRGAIEGLDPTDRRFRLYNEAAAVLLDPGKRAEYDAGLLQPGAGEAPTVPMTPATVAAPDAAAEPTPADPAPVPESAPAPGKASPGAPEAEPSRRRFRLGRGGAAAGTAAAVAAGDTDRDREPGRFAGLARTPLLVGLAVVTLLLAAGAAYLQFWRTDAADVEAALSEARQAAEIGLPKVFTYDYRFPERDHDQASRVLTGELREEYDALWEDAIAPNLERTEGTASSEVVGSAIVGGDADNAEILVVLNTVTANAQQSQELTLALTASLVEKDGVWLIEEIDGWDPEAVTDEDEDAQDGATREESTDGGRGNGQDKGQGKRDRQDRGAGRGQSDKQDKDRKRGRG